MYNLPVGRYGLIPIVNSIELVQGQQQARDKHE